MRSLSLLLPAAVIGAGACPPASLRGLLTWRVRFVERDPADDVARPAGWSDVVEACAAPCGEHPETDPLTGAHRWPTDLSGDGFAAWWAAPRPVRGPVRLRGDLVVDPLDGRPTTGRILRVRRLTETLRDGRVVALTARDLTAIPRSVDPGGPGGATRDRGVLLDLELGVT